jgi:transcriptional regulator with XRE-family HTH domain
MHSLKQGFAELVQSALLARFGRLPSAAFIARQVNRKLGEKQGISGETVRRWLRGLAMPTYTHLGALAAWLEIDFGQVLKFSLPGDASPPPIQNDSQRDRQTDGLTVRFAVMRMVARGRLLRPSQSLIL